MKKIKLILYIILILAISSGCINIKNKATKFEKKEMAPDSLQDISKSLQDILNNLDTIEQIQDGTYIVEESEKGTKETKKEEKLTEEKEETEEEKDKKVKQEILKKSWEKIDKEIEQLHRKWNEYQGEGLKKGVTTEKIDKLTDSLNLLTKSIENKKVKDIINYSSQSMLNTAAYFQLYKDEIRGEANKIKHAAYQSYLNGIEGKNEEAAQFLTNVEEETNKIRLKLKKDDSKIKILDKVGISLEDMKKALNESSIKLIRIKKDIIIKNLEDLAK